ncbi:nucleotide exchange factor GrpE [Actinomadura scrupuli]|uniref:nucleotide exchange factor GrpE n=1 Tax=Actinomadura scrupuli TaxID=559629 RepID=UPI003D96B0B2
MESEGDEATGFKDPAGFEIAAQRRDLIDASIAIADAVRDRDETLWRQVTDALAAAGVTTVAPDGEPFDPERHVPVLAEPTEDAKLHQTVAATGTVGYLDGKTWLRRPEVSVYEQDAQA